MKHRDIQPAHEKSVLDSFGGYLLAQGINLTVIDRPDPPDAIVNLDGKRSWIEITDAFQSADWAKSITSYAAEDKTHVSYKRGLITEPDQQACSQVKEVILKKYRKGTMKQLMQSYGQGILLVGSYTPLTMPEEIIDQAGVSINTELSQESSIFSSIYLYRNSESGHVFSQLL
ncbi:MULTISPECIES: hypothetical protein [Halomonadaceae]|uniref:hypothetical protein n=1 Tax=Halomonadaceae TaxID=28256 RepID=UPI001114E0F0|nr:MULTISPECIES: hypothetical protein [Halomonas]